ncbi:hypothetical protein BGZ65_006904 [Modicella reniformis]|uniref:N-acetyltransferase domain-containing protein n=1 Tax=Modicella reniformis TaxID=1440133 RepID=A0A9P6J533_9FUNG|nr:hypothetical protein BGZ65_006904 [Modicella reniformis]
MESSSSPTRPERKASVFVRLTNKDDKTQIEQIHSVVNKAYRSVSDERIKVEELAEIMEDTKNPLFIAFDSENGQPLGTLQLEPAEYYLDHGEYKKEGYSPTYIESLPKDQQVFLGLFSVDPSQQSRGIGRKLVEAALKHAREDMKRTQCVVNVLYMRDELINWYKKLGFVDHGEKVPFLEESRILQEDTHFSVLRLTL